MSEHDVVETITISRFASDLKLETIYAGRGMLTLSSTNITRPGLQIAGFFNCYDSKRVMVIGLTEYEYMKSFSSSELKERIARLFKYGEVPCIVVTRNLPVLPEILLAAKNYACPIFRTNKLSTGITNDLAMYLNNLLAPTTRVHGVLMDIFGVGILITGLSGVGKSETAIELIKRGHRLCADDSVMVKNVVNALLGYSPEKIRYFMELRGLGIINIKSMYGSGSVINEKKVELVVELETWNSEKNYDRLDGESFSEEILGISVPKFVIPVTPGRNIAIIIEVAARMFRLKEMGYDASDELIFRTIGR